MSFLTGFLAGLLIASLVAAPAALLAGILACARDAWRVRRVDAALLARTARPRAPDPERVRATATPVSRDAGLEQGAGRRAGDEIPY